MHSPDESNVISVILITVDIRVSHRGHENDINTHEVIEETIKVSIYLKDLLH